MKPTDQFSDLVELIQILRKECPWDRKQTHNSIKDNLIEEAYEAVEAIDERNFNELKKELGDLLLHVVFQTNMADEKEEFNIQDVIYTLQEKLIRRHPHVFENVEADDEEKVAKNWEQIKKEEGRKSVLDGIPRHLPALIKAQRMQEKAANSGFDWPESDGAWDKLMEELKEFKDALQNSPNEHQTEEYGDFLFTIVNYGRFFNLNAEDALRQTNKKFDSRFRFVEQSVTKTNRPMNDVPLEEMEKYWREAKRKE